MKLQSSRGALAILVSASAPPASAAEPIADVHLACEGLRSFTVNEQGCAAGL